METQTAARRKTHTSKYRNWKKEQAALLSPLKIMLPKETIDVINRIDRHIEIAIKRLDLISK